MADTGFDIGSYVQAAGIQQKLVDSTTQALKTIAVQSADFTDQIVGLITGGTDERGETALSLETKKLGELEAQNRKSAFYANQCRQRTPNHHRLTFLLHFDFALLFLVQVLAYLV